VVFKELPDMSVDLFHNLMILPESQERLKEITTMNDDKEVYEAVKDAVIGIRIGMKIIEGNEDLSDLTDYDKEVYKAVKGAVMGIRMKII
jgi:hypothetical protein